LATDGRYCTVFIAAGAIVLKKAVLCSIAVFAISGIAFFMGCGGQSNSVIPPAPSAPALALPSNGATEDSISVTLNWASAANTAYYNLQVSTSPTFTTTAFSQTVIMSTSASATGLGNNVTYYWQANATNAGGTSAWSNAWSFTMHIVAPMAPQLAAPASGATEDSASVALSWAASANATSYNIMVSTSMSSNLATSVFSQSGIVSTSATVSGLGNNATYYWQVSATNPGGTSAWTNAWSFTMNIAAPIAPVLAAPLNGATGDSTSLALSWTASADAASYTMQVSTSPTFATTVSSQTGITSTSASLSGLGNNGTYYWDASATNAGGTSAWSEAWSFTTAAAPLQASAIIGSWTAVDSVQNTGALTDSLILTMNIDSGNGLYLRQLRISHGSSGRTLDSAETFGTWAISGDSVVLDCTRSDYFSFAAHAQDSISCTLAKFPMTIPYALTGSIWTATFYYAVTGANNTFSMTRQ
jgi:hypothetical protein